MEEFKILAEEVIEKVGGKRNIEKVTHCVTRLRFVLHDESIVDDDSIKAINKVLGVVRSGGQYQVVIGPDVKKAFNAVEEELQTAESGSNKEQRKPVAEQDDIKNKFDSIKEKNKGNIINRVSRALMNMIYPLVPTMAAVGVLKGILSIFVAAGLLETTDGTYIILSAANDGFLYFLPIIIAFSVAKFVGSSPYVATVIGASLVLPAIVTALGEGGLTFLGIPVASVTYGNSIFPVMISVLVAGNFEKFLDRYIPAFLEFVKYIIVIVVMVPLTFLAIGPVFTAVGGVLANGTMGLYELSPLIAGVIFGAFWQVCVMLGLHYAFIPILTEITLREGSNAFNPILGAGVWALAGAALGFALKVKAKDKKAIGFTAMTSALFGISEPAIFGIALPYRKPFICAMIAGGIAGPLYSILKVNQYAVATVGGILTFGAHMDPSGNPQSLIGYFVGFAVAFGISAVLTYLTTDKEV